MDETSGKQVLTPREALICTAQRRGGAHLPVTQEIAGSNPVAPARSSTTKDFRRIQSPG